MTIEAGTVVMLKSGGEPMTVVAVDGETAECIWCGEEGDLFRESIPTLALQVAMPADDDDEEADDEAEADDTEDEGEDESETAEADEAEEAEETKPETAPKTSRKRTAA
jgi:uncharacterized protein YodC (DUF2158 family)